MIATPKNTIWLDSRRTQRYVRASLNICMTIYCCAVTHHPRWCASLFLPHCLPPPGLHARYRGSHCWGQHPNYQGHSHNRAQGLRYISTTHTKKFNDKMPFKTRWKAGRFFTINKAWRMFNQQPLSRVFHCVVRKSLNDHLEMKSESWQERHTWPQITPARKWTSASKLTCQ